jgi:hypothetical protein
MRGAPIEFKTSLNPIAKAGANMETTTARKSQTRAGASARRARDFAVSQATGPAATQWTIRRRGQPNGGAVNPASGLPAPQCKTTGGRTIATIAATRDPYSLAVRRMATTLHP